MSEPWLNPDCTKMILHTHEQGYKMGIYTTLVGMTLADVDILEKLRLSIFSVHLACGEKGDERIPVDDLYLNILRKISQSSMKVEYHFHGETLHPKIKPVTKELREKVGQHLVTTRGGK